MSTPEIAVIGMACVFPGSPDLPAFWRLIMQGTSAIREVPASRWNPDDYKLRARRGGFIDGLAAFDPLPLGVMPAAVASGDPEQFLVLSVVQDALHDAGLENRDEEFWQRTGIVIGRGGYIGNTGEALLNRDEGVAQTMDLLRSLAPDLSPQQAARLHELLIAAQPHLDAEALASAIPNLSAGRAANRFGLMGANYTVDAACASSLLALDHIARDLQTRRCDLGIAAGVHLCQKPHFWHVFETLGALSPRDICAPFDAGADGLVMGEGMGAIVLKRTEDALRDGDRIYATLRGVGISSDGRGMGLMAPRQEGQLLALQRAYESTGVDPQTVTLIEAHGTATPVGDATEIATLRNFFGERTPDADFPGIALGSVKSQIGHAMPAAGMAALIKTCLAIHHRVLPPTINVDKPHEALHRSRLAVNSRPRPWLTPAYDVGHAPLCAGVNAFGFGGINAHAVLEGAPPQQPRRKTYYFNPRAAELLTFAAAGQDELLAVLRGWQERLKSRTRPDSLRDAAFTSLRELPQEQEGQWRLALVIRDREDLDRKLSRALQIIETGQHPGQERDQLTRPEDSGILLSTQQIGGKVAVVFPGLGFPGLAGGYTTRLGDLCQQFPKVRERLQSADRKDKAGPPYPLRHQFFPPAHTPREELSRIERELTWSRRTLNGMMAANLATWEVLDELDIQPHAFAGFSLGEWSALVAGGVLQDENLLTFVEEIIDAYGNYGQEENPIEKDGLWSNDEKWGVWSIIAAPPEEVEAEMDIVREETGQVISLAMDTAPHQVYIGGHPQAVREVARRFQERGVWTQVLPFPAVHTPLAEEIVSTLQAGHENLEVNAPRVAVYRGSRAVPYPSDIEALRQNLFTSVMEPVHVRKTIAQMYDDGVRTYIQVGSGGKVLLNIRNAIGDRPYLAVSFDGDKNNGLESLLHALARLWVAGIAMNMEKLYDSRPCRNLDESHIDSPTKKLLELAPPRPHYAPDAVQEMRGLIAPHAPATAVPSAATGSPGTNGHSPIEDAMATMQQFLEIQKQHEEAESQIWTQFLATQSSLLSGMASTSTAPEVPVAPLPAYPLLGEIFHYIPGQELHSRFLLDLRSQPFLSDHCLLRFPPELAALKPLEERLPTMPMTVGMEIIAEAASTLWPQYVLAELRDLEAVRWTALEDIQTLPLRIEARTIRQDAEEIEVTVELHPEYEDASKNSADPALRGKAVLRTALPSAPAPLLMESGPPSPHTAREYYEGALFHGPTYHVIEHLGVMSKSALEATLRAADAREVLGHSLEGYNGPILEPALLDGFGQLLGYPVALENWSVFPSRIARVQRFAPTPAAGEPVRIVMKYRKLDARRVQADLDGFDGEGNLWLRIEGWLDWRLLWPKEFLRFEKPAREWFVAQANTVPGQPDLEYRTVSHAMLSGVKPDWFARVYLRPDEWREYHESPRLDRLLGRIAAKDAIRGLYFKERGIWLHPLEISITNEASGAPVVAIEGYESIPLHISISHLEDEAVAIASPNPVGLDLAPIEVRDTAWERLTFNAAELRLIDEASGDRNQWLHRAWCAKEAAAKKGGLGLSDLPKFQVARIDAVNGAVEVIGPQGPLLVTTWAQDKNVVAVSLA